MSHDICPDTGEPCTCDGSEPCTCAVSYTHLRAHETDSYLVCRLLLEKKKNKEKTRRDSCYLS